MLIRVGLVSATISHLLRAWDASSAYLSQVLMGILAVFVLLKDWKDYGNLSKKWGKSIPVVLALGTVVLTILSVRETYSARIEESANHATITQLSTSIDHLRSDNRTNAEGFRSSFADLYRHFSDLQSRVQNADLLREIVKTKKELIETQTKLTPIKVTPVASFPTTDESRIPITELTIARSASSVEVKFLVYNPSNSNAQIGAVTVRICEICKYADEPSGFTKVSGAPESDREFDFQHIWADSALQTLAVHLTVPPSVTRFQIGVFVACANCSVPKQQHLTVILQ